MLSGGNWSIIDSTGAVRLELGAVSSVEVTPSYILADGSYYTVNDYTEAVFYGYTGVPCEEGFWVRGANGVRVFRSDGDSGLLLRGRRAARTYPGASILLSSLTAAQRPWTSTAAWLWPMWTAL